MRVPCVAAGALLAAGMLSADTPASWEDRLKVASAKQAAGDYTHAIDLLKRLIAERTSTGPDERRAVALHNLALAEEDAGDYREAARCFQIALAEWQKTGGSSERLVRPLNNLISLYIESRNFSKAEQELRRLTEILQSLPGAPPQEIAVYRNSRAAVLMQQSRYAEADALLAAAEPETAAALGADAPVLAALLNTWGLNSLQRGDWPAAAAHFEGAIAVLKKGADPGHPVVARTYSNLARAYRLGGRPREAEQLAALAVAMFEERLGPDHPALAAALAERAAALRDLKRTSEAKALAKRARTIMERRNSETHADATVDVAALRRGAGR